MNWIVKALVQKAISSLPGREKINHFLQRHLTKNIPLNEDLFRRYVWVAQMHLLFYERYNTTHPLSAAHFLEFGTGWDIQLPLLYYACGVNHQICVDLRPLLQLDLVNHTLARLKAHQSDYEHIMGRRFRSFPEGQVHSLNDLSRYGINYKAPMDMRQTDVPSESVDFISTTGVFEHIPEPEFPFLLKECRRLLKKGGLLSSSIDMVDHFSRFDNHISIYNYLKYSSGFWTPLQSLLNYQNRLRLSDYQKIFEEAGFQPLNRRIEKPLEKEIQQLKAISLDDAFKRYSWEDLGAKEVIFVTAPMGNRTPASALKGPRPNR